MGVKDKDKRPSNTEFALTWQSSTTISDIAEKLGMSRGAVSSRATRMRKAGVKLKSFDNGGYADRLTRRKVDDINNLIKGAE